MSKGQRNVPDHPPEGETEETGQYCEEYGQPDNVIWYYADAKLGTLPQCEMRTTLIALQHPVFAVTTRASVVTVRRKVSSVVIVPAVYVRVRSACRRTLLSWRA